MAMMRMRGAHRRATWPSHRAAAACDVVVAAGDAAQLWNATHCVPCVYRKERTNFCCVLIPSSEAGADQPPHHHESFVVLTAARSWQPLHPAPALSCGTSARGSGPALPRPATGGRHLSLLSGQEPTASRCDVAQSSRNEPPESHKKRCAHSGSHALGDVPRDVFPLICSDGGNVSAQSGIYIRLRRYGGDAAGQKLSTLTTMLLHAV
eukprot:COSAG01_NODE_9723_length_2361_cov_5.264810_3_plen_208_part_00